MICFACWPLSTMLSQVFWHECLVETPEPVWVPFLLLGLLDLCPAGIPAVLSPLLDHSKTCPVPVCILVSFTASWSGLYGFSTALKYSLTCSTLFMVCTRGRSSMNLMVSLDVQQTKHDYKFQTNSSNNNNNDNNNNNNNRFFLLSNARRLVRLIDSTFLTVHF